MTSLPTKDQLEDKFKQITEAARAVKELMQSSFVSKIDLNESNKAITASILAETITKAEYQRIAKDLANSFNKAS